MNLRHLSLRASFSLAFSYFLFFLVIQPQSIPTLQYFTPFLICAIYRTDKNHALWLALGCGFMMDLYASHTHFGFYATSNVITLWMIYGLRRQFFSDQLSTLPIVSSIFSLIVSIVELVLLFLFDQAFSLTWQWVLVDLLLLAVMDAAYAYVAFAIPILGLFKLTRWFKIRRVTSHQNESA